MASMGKGGAVTPLVFLSKECVPIACAGEGGLGPAYKDVLGRQAVLRPKKFEVPLMPKEEEK